MDSSPTWTYCDYRLKPEPKIFNYRVGLYLSPVGGPTLFFIVDKYPEKYWEESSWFIKWVTDWQEVEVGE